MGGFLGQTNPLGVGGKGFFSPVAVATQVVPPPSPELFTLVDTGVPSGFSFTFLGWDGQNGVAGPGSTGALISGQAGGLPPGVQFTIGNCGTNDSPAPLAPPFFCITSGGVFAQNQFVSVAPQGLPELYATATADFFTNGGGCGPTMWAWATPVAELFPGGEFFWVFNPPP